MGGEGVGAGARRRVSCVGRVEEEGEHQMGIHGCIVIKAPIKRRDTLDERSGFGLFREEGRGRYIWRRQAGAPLIRSECCRSWGWLGPCPCGHGEQETTRRRFYIYVELAHTFPWWAAARWWGRAMRSQSLSARGRCEKHVRIWLAPPLDLALVPARCTERYAAPRNGQEVRHWRKVKAGRQRAGERARMV